MPTYLPPSRGYRITPQSTTSSAAPSVKSPLGGSSSPPNLFPRDTQYLIQAIIHSPDFASLKSDTKYLIHYPQMHDDMLRALMRGTSFQHIDDGEKRKINQILLQQGLPPISNSPGSAALRKKYFKRKFSLKKLMLKASNAVTDVPKMVMRMFVPKKKGKDLSKEVHGDDASSSGEQMGNEPQQNQIPAETTVVAAAETADDDTRRTSGSLQNGKVEPQSHPNEEDERVRGERMEYPEEKMSHEENDAPAPSPIQEPKKTEIYDIPDGYKGDASQNSDGETVVLEASKKHHHEKPAISETDRNYVFREDRHPLRRRSDMVVASMEIHHKSEEVHTDEARRRRRRRRHHHHHHSTKQHSKNGHGNLSESKRTSNGSRHKHHEETTKRRTRRHSEPAPISRRRMSH